VIGRSKRAAWLHGRRAGRAICGRGRVCRAKLARVRARWWRSDQ
jgi:hypothetical protein